VSTRLLITKARRITKATNHSVQEEFVIFVFFVLRDKQALNMREG